MDLDVSVQRRHDLFLTSLLAGHVRARIGLTRVGGRDLLLKGARRATRAVLSRRQLRHRVVAVQVHDGRVDKGRDRH